VNYVSPFGAIESDDHNWPDALCLSRTHCDDAISETLAEFHEATLAAIERPAAQPAFFLARQLAELGLKALVGSGYPPTHSLTELLDGLAERDDDLVGGGNEQELVVAFIRDLDRHDARGDQGRYPTTRQGAPSLATVCCADPVHLREHVVRLYGYLLGRLIEDEAKTDLAVSQAS
jgi:HEPN domain-containing protein